MLIVREIPREEAQRRYWAFYEAIKLDALVKSPYLVIPAKAGIQKYLILLDPGLVVIPDSDPGRGDEIWQIPTFYERIKLDI